MNDSSDRVSGIGSNGVRRWLAGGLCALLTLAAAGHAPQLFVPGKASAGLLLAGAVFSADGQVAYFTKYSAFEVDAVKTIVTSRKSGDSWSEPAAVAFSGRWSDTTPFLAQNGARLYFASNRPVDGKPKDDFDLWFVEREGSDWGTPQHLDTVNGPANDASPALTRSGVLYFSSWREEGGLGLGDLWRAEPNGNGFKPPKNLGARINGPSGEWGVTVSPDEQTLVFESSGRPEGLSGAGDLYLSRMTADGWSAPVHLKPPVNSDKSDLAPRLSADGSELHFASTRSGHLQMWSIAFPAIADNLR